MVDADTTTTEGMDRLTTFELDMDETLVIMAGRGELDNRVIFRGRASGRRYAVVDVDDLTGVPDPRELSGSPRHDDLRVIGSVATIPETEAGTSVSLARNGEEVVDFDAKGVYGLLWIPYD